MNRLLIERKAEITAYNKLIGMMRGFLKDAIHSDDYVDVLNKKTFTPHEIKVIELYDKMNKLETSKLAFFIGTVCENQVVRVEAEESYYTNILKESRIFYKFDTGIVVGRTFVYDPNSVDYGMTQFPNVIDVSCFKLMDKEGRFFNTDAIDKCVLRYINKFNFQKWTEVFAKLNEDLDLGRNIFKMYNEIESEQTL